MDSASRSPSALSLPPPAAVAQTAVTPHSASALLSHLSELQLSLSSQSQEMRSSLSSLQWQLQREREERQQEERRWKREAVAFRQLMTARMEEEREEQEEAMRRLGQQLSQLALSVAAGPPQPGSAAVGTADTMREQQVASLSSRVAELESSVEAISSSLQQQQQRQQQLVLEAEAAATKAAAAAEAAAALVTDRRQAQDTQREAEQQPAADEPKQAAQSPPASALSSSPPPLPYNLFIRLWHLPSSPGASPNPIAALFLPSPPAADGDTRGGSEGDAGAEVEWRYASQTEWLQSAPSPVFQQALLWDYEPWQRELRLSVYDVLQETVRDEDRLGSVVVPTTQLIAAAAAGTPLTLPLRHEDEGRQSRIRDVLLMIECEQDVEQEAAATELQTEAAEAGRADELSGEKAEAAAVRGSSSGRLSDADGNAETARGELIDDNEQEDSDDDFDDEPER